MVASVGSPNPSPVANDASVSHVMTMAVTGTGLYRVERAGRTFDTPEAWLVLPADRDRTWEYPVGDATVIAKLREAFPDLPEKPDPKTVFLRLRELRNKW